MEQDFPLGLRISLLHRCFRKKMDEMLREQDLTGVQFGVLAALTRLEQQGEAEINQKDLEQVTHVTHPTMTEIIKRLEKKGFLRCETSRRDRRYKSIHSTERGRGLRYRVQEVDEASSQWLCRGLTPEQREQLTVITDRMLKNAMSCCEEGGESRCD